MSVHSERPMKLRNGLTYCACGNPWPCVHQPPTIDVQLLALAISASDGDRRRPSKGLMTELIPKAMRIAVEYERLLKEGRA